LLAGFCAFLFFWGLSNFGLVGADEPRYAQVAHEMFSRHDWITPTLGGKAWLEKPPLYYWQTMLAYRIFGVSDWAARFGSAVDATLMVIAVYFFLRRFRSGVEFAGFQLDGALMAASACGVIGFARAASTDMPLAAMFTIAMLCWYVWHDSDDKRYLASFYVLLALGMLAKGPVAPFLAIVIVVIFAIAKGDRRPIVRSLWIPGVALFCVVAFPWFVAVQLKNPEFFRIFIVEHNLGRFGSDIYHHSEPFWYYLPVSLLGLAPWTIFISAAVFEGARDWWRQKRELFRAADELRGFLLIWLVAPIIFFSFSASKLPGYILLALPAGTLLLAEYVRRHVDSGNRPSLLLVAAHSLIATLPMFAALMLQSIVLQHRLPWGQGTAIAFALSVVLAFGIAMTLRGQVGFRILRFVTLVPIVLAVAVALRLRAPLLDSTLSARPLSQEITRIDNRTLPVAILRLSRETEYGLQFYRNQNIARYELGQIPDGEHLLVTREGWQKNIAKWTTGRRVTYLGSFAPQGLDYYWVARK
jgi:4-amino-4-deoxy-L-arabinose transferase-like glycosyltransferase